MQHQRRIVSLAALAGLPGSIVALALLWTNDYPARIQWGLSLVIAVVWIGAAIATERQVVSPFHAISNLLKALREHDYSVRGKVESHDAVGVVVEEINDLAHTLRSQRIDVLEAGKLLNKIMDEIDVAILSFDLDDKLRLINRAGERLLDGTAKTLLGRTAGELGLAECLYGRTPRLMEFGLAGGGGRWEVRRTTFRQGGVPQQLLVLSDLSRALREEERRAWQRIVRVLGHELNNSLTPISSISESLTGLLSRRSRPNDWEQDLTRGLSVISSRSESLTQFVESYSKLARLPEPTLEPCAIAPLVRRIVQLETRLGVEILPGPDITIMVDVSQIEQLLINLIRNAVDAALETAGDVRIGWKSLPTQLELWIEDGGPGLAGTANLFVPFFTTKQGGSGIGLVLCRQIAEAHNGALVLRNRIPGPGCEARLRLPRHSDPTPPGTSSTSENPTP